MPNRFNLPDIDFLDKDPDKIVAEMLQHINDKTGLEFQRADPRRKFIEGLAAFVVFERNRIDYALKQTLTAYANDNALDLKGDEFSTPRLPATAAKTKIRFNLESNRAVTLVIIEGTRIKIAEVFFIAETTYVVPVGQSTFDVDVVCTEVGEVGNGYLAGEPTSLVDPLPYVISVENLTVTSGGADIESDDQYAERIRLAPEGLSVAGPQGAYRSLALKASQDIADVNIDSPEPNLVEITVLLKNGELPTQQHLDSVLEVCSADDARPLTDRVVAKAPNIITYNMKVSYWLPQSAATIANELITKIEAKFEEFLVWQKSKIGRAVNRTELIDRLKNLDEGVKGATRVEIDTPFTQINKDEIAVADVTSITFEGFVSNE